MLCPFQQALLLLCWLALVRVEGSSCINRTNAVNSDSGKRTFYLLTLVPYSNPDSYLNPSWNGGDNVRPAFDLAVDLVNQRDDILGNATLKLIHQSDGCDQVLTPLTITSFLSEAYAERGNLAGLIGPSCSSSTSALAPLVGRQEIDAVSLHFAGSPIFEDRSSYQNLLGLLGSTKSFVQGFLHLINQGKWTRIAIVYDDSRQYYSSTAMLLMEMSKKFSNVTIGYMIPVSRISIPLEEVPRHMLRVIFVLTPVSLAQIVLCRAYTLGMTYGRYQYIIMSASLGNFRYPAPFYYRGETHQCSGEDIIENVLDRSFLLHYNLFPNLDANLSAGISYSEFADLYASYRENYTLSTGKKSTESFFGTLAFDAVWSWALVLDKLTKECTDFKVQYGNRDNSNRIAQAFYHLNFEGMSGTVSFDNQSGYLRREVVISQVQDDSTCIVASTGPDGDVRRNHTNPCGDPLILIDDSVNQIDRESSELATFFLLVTVVEFIIVFVLHLATLKNRHSPSVKASSVTLTNVSYTGMYIFILGTFLWTLFAAASLDIHLRHYFCQLLWAWTVPIGFSLSFSPVLMKTYRLYRIFEHYLDPGPFISSPHLITTSLFITLLYLAVSVTWTASDSFVTKTRNHFDDTASGRVKLAVEYYCTCQYQVLWGLSLGVLTLVLLFMGTLLALLSRKIKISSFTTSSLRILLFLMTIVILLGGSVYAVSELVDNQRDRKSYFNFSSLCLLLNTVVALFIGFVFLPPLLPLIRRTHAVDQKLKTLHQVSLVLVF